MAACGDVSLVEHRKAEEGDYLVEGRPGVSAGTADVAVPEEVGLEALFGDAGGAEVVGLAVRVDGNGDGGGCHDWRVFER